MAKRRKKLRKKLKRKLKKEEEEDSILFFKNASHNDCVGSVFFYSCSSFSSLSPKPVSSFSPRF